jgi:gluconokinase
MIVLVMGVSGAGKTTVGKMLAAGLGCEFLDADDFHPPANVAKMRAGTPLTDADRQPWLAQLNAALRLRVQRNADVVLACSALKHAYREAILRGIGEAKIVYLRGEKAVIAARLAERRDHYMNPVLLESQFALLEEPRNAIVVDIAPDPEEIAARVRAAWIQ